MTPRWRLFEQEIRKKVHARYRQRIFEVEDKPVLIDNESWRGSWKVDVVVREKTGRLRSILVSCKWQESQGSASEKLPFEFLALLDTIGETPCDPDRAQKRRQYPLAYIVLGGDERAWKYWGFYVRGGLRSMVPRGAARVRILGEKDFLRRLRSKKGLFP